MKRRQFLQWSLMGTAGLMVPSSLFLSRKAYATSDFNPTPVLTTSSQYWDKIEMLEDNNPNLPQETFISANQQTDPEIVAAFNNNATPPSSQFLLGYGPGWQSPSYPTPVLLVHGAATNMNQSWCNPQGNGTPGLMQYLSQQGYAVFAINFAHNQGNNYYQAEVLADAITKIKDVTGASQVDIVAHSKGNMAARLYVSSYVQSWQTTYRGDVRKYLMLGAPNQGLDFSFVWTDAVYTILQNNDNAPLPWTLTYYDYVWQDTTYYSIYTLTDSTGGNAFPGQCQMLYRWDNVYGLAENQNDWYTTYYGGQGYVSYSYGIDYAINEGGSMISALNNGNNGVAPDVKLYILAGTNNVFDNGVVGESRGPSDGLLFVDSVLYTTGVTSQGAVVYALDQLNINHWDLVYNSSAMDWVATQLSS